MKTARCCAVWRDVEGRQAELNVLQIGPDLYEVVALSGIAGSCYQRAVKQGPFDGVELAQGCCAVLGDALSKRGYRKGDSTGRLWWELEARRAAREICANRAPFTPDSRFHPEDAEIWPPILPPRGE